MCVAFAGLWIGSIGVGGAMLFRYDSTPGSAGRPAEVLPRNLAEVATPVAGGGLKLVVSIHPKCPCSRATMTELARIMTACHGRLETTVLMVRPEGQPEGWEKTDLWTSAARIPGVTVVADAGGAASEKFGADTSGQAMLYDASGKLIFSGGITESRGHEGDNAGQSAIIALVSAGKRAGGAAQGTAAKTPVFGCSLFDECNSTAQGGGR
jgi:hypothetical protein